MDQDRLLDPPQAADFLPHLNLGVAVGFEDRLGQVAEEMVVAIAVRYGRCSAAIPVTKASCFPSEIQRATGLLRSWAHCFA